MPRLIDANEILKSEHQHYDYMSDEYYVLVRDIENAPTVDAEPVVRCKDCKHYKEFEGEMECWARPMMFPREPNDFCSMGERKEE